MVDRVYSRASAVPSPRSARSICQTGPLPLQSRSSDIWGRLIARWATDCRSYVRATCAKWLAPTELRWPITWRWDGSSSSHRSCRGSLSWATEWCALSWAVVGRGLSASTRSITVRCTLWEAKLLHSRNAISDNTYTSIVRKRQAHRPILGEKQGQSFAPWYTGDVVSRELDWESLIPPLHSCHRLQMMTDRQHCGKMRYRLARKHGTVYGTLH